MGIIVFVFSSQAVLVDRTLYVSGVLGLDKETMKLVDGGIKAEVTQALQSLGYILQEAGSCFEKVVKVTILMKDMADFGTVNEVYSECKFGMHFCVLVLLVVGHQVLTATSFFFAKITSNFNKMS